MSEKKPFDFTKTIQAVAADGKRRRLLGKSLYAENIFQFLCQQTDIRCQLLLCTDFGLILGYTGSPALPDVSGLALPADAFSKLQRAAQVYRLKGYIIAAPSETSDDLVMEKSLLKLQSDMNQLLRILDENEQQSQCLLRSLDSMRNAISIYDRNARLLFGNMTFCSNFQIEDLDTVLGIHIEDIMERNSLKAYSMEDNSSHMKMMDVLKDGKEVLDWEVRLESPDSASNALLVSNDMYPVRDNLGRVQGMVELMRSRQQDMTRAKKMVSFTADAAGGLLGFIRKYPDFMVVLAGCILVMAFHNIGHTYMIQIMEGVGGDSASMGTAFSIEAVMELPVMFGFYKLIKKISADSLMIVSAAAFTLKAVTYLSAASVTALYLAQILQMFSNAVFVLASVYYADKKMAPEDQVTGQSCMTASISIGAVLGNLLGGQILSVTGLRGMLLTGVLLAAAGSAIMAAGIRFGAKRSKKII